MGGFDVRGRSEFAQYQTYQLYCATQVYRSTTASTSTSTSTSTDAARVTTVDHTSLAPPVPLSPPPPAYVAKADFQPPQILLFHLDVTAVDVTHGPATLSPTPYLNPNPKPPPYPSLAHSRRRS